MCGDNPAAPAAAGAAAGATTGAAGAATTGAPAATTAAAAAASSAAPAESTAAAAPETSAAVQQSIWTNLEANRRHLQQPNGYFSPEGPVAGSPVGGFFAPEGPVAGAPVGGGFHEHLNAAADLMNKAANKLKAYGEGMSGGDKGGDDSEGGGCSCDKEKSDDNPCGPCGAPGGAPPPPQPPAAQSTPQQPQQPVPGTPQIWNVAGNNNPAGRNQLQPAQPVKVDPECEKKKTIYCDRICGAFSAPNGAGPNVGAPKGLL